MNNLALVASLDDTRLAYRALRLVKEYMVDFDLRAAAMRADVGIDEAVDIYKKPIFTKTIAELVDLMESDAVISRQQLLNQLKREAFADGLDATSGSRIKALTELARLLGMDPPTKSEMTLNSPVINLHLHASAQSKLAPTPDGCIPV